MQKDPDLWSGCISGALTEAAFLEAFEKAGFYGIGILTRDATPGGLVEGIEFRLHYGSCVQGNPTEQEKREGSCE